MSGVVFNQGSWVFMPDDDDMYVPAQVVEGFSSGEEGRVDRDGHKVKVSSKESRDIVRMDEESLGMIDNMVQLKELNEASILHNLRLRFENDKIYTNVGTILVSVNPFKMLPLYTSEMLEKYKAEGYRDLPPHVYGVADDAYKSMVSGKQDQACIVSGESGAGKTEATKIFLQYIAEVSGASLAKDTDEQVSFEDASLQEQILKANPLMEAFGNAKTVRNNNSSRFGKWIEVTFNNNTGSVIGGAIVQYLLEKSRLVAQAEGERNYHIFYNLCAGASMDSAFREKFRLSDPEDYHYLNQSGVTEVEGISDENDFETLLNSMETIGIDTNEQDDVIRTLAGILHLGNIEFEKGDSSFEDSSKVANTEMLELASAQFGVSPDNLEKALCYTSIRTNREVMEKANNTDKAVDSRDVLAKEMYAKMFEWLINRINKSLAAKTKTLEKVSPQSTSIIGVLDIFGFESFKHNSFEQLCINYCNEKLQFHFNEHIFKLEQNEYKTEGVDVSQIDFVDNQACLDLFEAKRSGIFSTLDEEMNVPRGSDVGFLKKINKHHGEGKKHQNFKGPGVKTTYERESFLVVHYAGEVRYNVTAFLEKNRDKMSQDITELLAGSSIKYVSSLIKKDSSSSNSRGTIKKAGSLGSKFKDQLGKLMKTLNATNPHFIRCVKPNSEKVGNLFTAQMILDQLRYAGLLEVCRIRQIGYPVRKEFKHFYRRYIPLAAHAKDTGQLVSALCGEGLLTKGEFQMGKSKVFLRNAPHNDLEAAREVALRAQAMTLQKIARGFIARCQYLVFVKTLDDLRDGIQKRDYEFLKGALDAAGDLPNQGQSLPLVRKALDLLHVLEEELRVKKLLEDAVAKRELNNLRSAVAAAQEMGLKCPQLEDANQMIQVLEEEKQCLEEIKRAIDARELDKIVMALEKASNMGLQDAREAKQAMVLKERLQEEERVTDEVQAATEEMSLENLEKALAGATDLGVDNQIIKDGQACMDKLMASADEETQERVRLEDEQKKKEREAKTKKAKQELMEAAKEEDLERLADAKERILELGITGDEVDSLMRQANGVEDMKDLIDELEASVNTLKTVSKSQKGISLGDVKPLSNAIKVATEKGLTEDIPQLADAISLEQRLMEQVVVQKELQSAIDSGELSALKDSLDHAGDLDMDIDLVTRVKKLIKDKEAARPKSSRVKEREQKTDMDEEEFERHRSKNIKKAKNDRYNFQKYYNIRSDGDYVKSLYFNKRKTVELKLKYQKNVIPKSILELDKDLNKKAIGIHKSLLGYCGEQLMSFPATLAQDILIKGLEQPELVDEIYIQLCKHLTQNPKPESVGRTWQLMCMAVGTFPPSSDFEFYLLNFLLEHVAIGGLVGNYARYSLRRLDGMLIRGASGFVPNIDEILAYKERPPILATIELIDGTPLTEDLPITPDLNCEKVLEICTHFLSLQDERSQMFGIFVQDIDDENEEDHDLVSTSSYSAARAHPSPSNSDEPPPPPLPTAQADELPPRTPRPLRGKDFLGDIVVQMTRQKIKHTFVFKRKIFLPNSNGPSDDPVYSRLMYLQAADEVINGNIPVTKEADVVQLTAMAIAADGDDFPATAKEILDEGLMEYIPTPWRSKKTDEKWAQAIVDAKSKVAKKPLDEIQSKYVEMVQKMPLYGHTFFYVRKETDGNDIICSVNHLGVHFLTLSRELMETHKFSELHRWGGSSRAFWILVSGKSKKEKTKVCLTTSQARDLSSLILDYAVLAAEYKK